MANKTLVIVAAVSILGSVGTAVGTAMFMNGRNRAAPEAKAHEEPVKKAPESVHPLGELVINLADPGTDLRYIKISIAIGIEEKVEDAAVKDYDPVLRDVVIHVVSRKRFAELRQPNALDKLKAELIEAMKGKVPHATITDVYIEGYAMQ
jgi:flagellar basal body-associated protein FliL